MYINDYIEANQSNRSVHPIRCTGTARYTNNSHIYVRRVTIDYGSVETAPEVSRPKPEILYHQGKRYRQGQGMASSLQTAGNISRALQR